MFENELLPVPSLLDEVSTKPISLLTTDVKSRKFIGVNRESMEEALKSLNVGVKVLAWRSNAKWDILLQIEEAAKSLAESIFKTKSLRLQTVYGDEKN